MRIIITGHNGFIGKHLMRKLKDSGHDVIGIDKPHHDICDVNSVIDLVQGEPTDIVVHCAALTSVVDSEMYQKQYANVNITGTVAMLKVFKQSKFIFLSTSAVYGEGVAHTEDGPTNPKSFYAVSKLAAEECIKHINPNHVILRLANVIGEGSRDNVYNRFERENPITVYGDGTQTRDFILVDDVCTAIVLAFDNNITGTYNIGSGNTTRVIDLALTFNKEIKFEQKRDGEINMISMNLSKAFEKGLLR